MTGNAPIGHHQNGRINVQTLDTSTGERDTAYYTPEQLIALGYGAINVMQIVVEVEWRKVNG